MNFYIYRLLAYTFYYIGNIFCRVPTYWGYKIYQIAMRESVQYDDMSGNKIWKVID